MRLRAPTRQDLEWRERMAAIRTAARNGKSPAEIAELHQLPRSAVERVLAPVDHPRISDPVHLLQGHRKIPGAAPIGVQLYWVGFLMAAGHIWGQGNSLTLVVTIGEKSRSCIEVFTADILTDHIHCEFCHSSTVGWQVYLRDQGLCKALFPWGVPSDLHGDDSALLDDLPREFAIPFICGYVAGNRSIPNASHHVGAEGFTVQGTPAVLARLNLMVQKYWGVQSGKVTSRQSRAELRFSDPGARREIRSQLSACTARLRT